MKSIEQFKEKLNSDVDFRNKFYGIKNEEEAINIAKQLGYDLDIKDTKQDEELTDNFLEAVAGGKGNISGQSTDVQIVVTGNGSKGEHYGQIDQG